MADDAQTDSELLKAWQAGSQAAANALYRRFKDPLTRFFASKVKPQDVDELIQQTWEALIKNQQRPGEAERQIDSVRAYVRGIARHVAFAYYRKHGAKQEFDPEVDNLAAIAPSISQQLSLRRNVKRLELAMESLPVDFQIVAEAAMIEGFTGPEIAEMYDLPQGTVRSRLRRAKEQIDELMRRWEIRMGPGE
jgi:RNA polymerase sigma factor (sigma-70 family)